MTALKIPTRFDEELLSRAAAGESTRDIAAWLRDENYLKDCSHMAVARRLQALTRTHAAHSESLADLDGRLEAQLFALNGLHEELQDLAELSELPAEDPRRGDLETKKFSILNRRLIALAVFRYLTTKRREALVGKVRDERFAQLADRLPLNDDLERVGNEFRDHQAVRQAERARVVAPPPTPKPVVMPKPVVAPPSLKGTDRNKPCPCGSGKKAKKCCAGATVTAA